MVEEDAAAVEEDDDDNGNDGAAASGLLASYVTSLMTFVEDRNWTTQSGADG